MKLDDIKKLHQKKYRTQFGFYLVEGEHLILELAKALSPTQKPQVTLYISEDYAGLNSALTEGFNLVNVTARQMAQISDTKSPQGIIACVPLPDKGHSDVPATSNERCIYLHEIQDPGNLGTILRTLAWFGGFRLLLSPNSVDPYNSKVVRASMGAIFHLPIELNVPLDALSQRFAHFACLDLKGRPVSTPAFSGYPCYLFGNEARGIPHQALEGMKAEAFTIPGKGKIDSLNLATTVSMCALMLSQ